MFLVSYNHFLWCLVAAVSFFVLLNISFYLWANLFCLTLCLAFFQRISGKSIREFIAKNESEQLAGKGHEIQ